MAKLQTVFFCRNCGAKSSKWVGRCNTCHEWNTYDEEIVAKQKGSSPSWSTGKATGSSKPKLLEDIAIQENTRIIGPDEELNRVLGGGIVPGSVILVGGEPGIGKSTLLLQYALKLTGLKVLYISGEESDTQIRLRAERLGGKNSSCYILTETEINEILKQTAELDPGIIIVDSIQTIFSTEIDSVPGSLTQIREATAKLMQYAKQNNIPVFLIGHITKEGIIAGPKLLEHMVDTVLQFEGDRHHVYRILRTTKNRFGSTSEIGIYEMQGTGLREVSNPYEISVSQREEILAGITISATIEGLRPLLIETQALVSPAVYGNPQRSSNGYDSRRLNMLLAVLEKKCGFRMLNQDVFINLAGGLKIEDPGIDLGIVAALVSSYEDIPVEAQSCFIGEVGLSGEVRAVNRIEQRISEAAKLGFKTIYLSSYNKFNDRQQAGIKLVKVNRLDEFVRKFLK